MEWVETTGRTVEEAKDLALDQLGVDERDAEFEILEEPKSGLFGRLRAEARVRARVRPSKPRPKVDRRDRRRGRGAGEEPAAATTVAERDEGDDQDEADERPARGRRRGRPRSGGGDRSPARTSASGDGRETADDSGHELSMDVQGQIVRTFLDGLVESFGLDGTTTVEVIDEETVEVNVEGDDLGLLIGPRGQTLQAVQELAKTVVQRHALGARYGRIHIDIGAYRRQRREALSRFTQGLAEEVRDTGVARALEPMNPADRKVVHDTVNEIDGVTTISEGEEPNRRVLIRPDEG